MFCKHKQLEESKTDSSGCLCISIGEEECGILEEMP